MKIKYIYAFAFILLHTSILLNAQQRTENLVIVTLDGFRWQEVFGGVDSLLMTDKNYVHDTAGMRNKYWSPDVNERKNKLMPFFWNMIAREGQLYGNRWKGSLVNNANKYWFSYPGYNEIFTGYPDDSVNSNDKIWNKNTNVLEYINRQSGYRDRVAAFTTWDVFPYILNSRRSGIYVNADVDTLRFTDPGLQLLNDMQFLAPQPVGVRPDLITYFAAREYLKKFKPKVLYIAFDETDDFAHGGNYEQYISSAHSQDAMIADLWKTLQGMPEYKENTTLLITCDHGRGDAVKEEWKHHGQKIADAGQIWIAALGPDTRPGGEMKQKETIFQAQIASTLAALLGFNFKPAHPVMEPIRSIYK
ncbi:MAG: alkaline phosphatase family protein [Bacteroidetes bacterium]|nr:alkaline phosphatase family protein [Bacteroidota bacterium]